MGDICLEGKELQALVLGRSRSKSLESASYGNLTLSEFKGHMMNLLGLIMKEEDGRLTRWCGQRAKTSSFEKLKIKLIYMLRSSGFMGWLSQALNRHKPIYLCRNSVWLPANHKKLWEILKELKEWYKEKSQK
ncbi:MAG: hypothetical protein DRN04_18310 [Thermoprotei archaeon]|nr:MAG: hypothetical protein DRN04_18310 [Thermoprotei archaeon]